MKIEPEKFNGAKNSSSSESKTEFYCKIIAFIVVAVSVYYFFVKLVFL